MIDSVMVVQTQRMSIALVVTPEIVNDINKSHNRFRYGCTNSNNVNHVIDCRSLKII